MPDVGDGGGAKPRRKKKAKKGRLKKLLNLKKLKKSDGRARPEEDKETEKDAGTESAETESAAAAPGLRRSTRPRRATVREFSSGPTQVRPKQDPVNANKKRKEALSRNLAKLGDSCPHCFDRFHDLEKHLKTKHFARSARCPWCSYKSFRKDLMKTHLFVVHHVEKLFKCSACLKMFADLLKVNQHIKEAHQGKGEIIRVEDSIQTVLDAARGKASFVESDDDDINFPFPEDKTFIYRLKKSADSQRNMKGPERSAKWKGPFNVVAEEVVVADELLAGGEDHQNPDELAGVSLSCPEDEVLYLDGVESLEQSSRTEADKGDIPAATMADEQTDPLETGSNLASSDAPDPLSLDELPAANSEDVSGEARSPSRGGDSSTPDSSAKPLSSTELFLKNSISARKLTLSSDPVPQDQGGSPEEEEEVPEDPPSLSGTSNDQKADVASRKKGKSLRYNFHCPYCEFASIKQTIMGEHVLLRHYKDEVKRNSGPGILDSENPPPTADQAKTASTITAESTPESDEDLDEELCEDENSVIAFFASDSSSLDGNQSPSVVVENDDCDPDLRPG